LSLLRSKTLSQKPGPQPLALLFEDVYRQHFEFVYHRAARLGGPSIDAEDAAQEVFLVVARKLDTFDGTSLVTTWLYGITLNVVRAMRRRAFLRRLWEQRAVVSNEPAIQSVDRAEVMAAQRIAYQILDSLSPKKREVFILAEFEELSCGEIAAIVGAKTETIWSRLHYAREDFMRGLEQRKLHAWRAA
jgi:RNA polymerase sigma-70 factor, ECF subfamily